MLGLSIASAQDTGLQESTTFCRVQNSAAMQEATEGSSSNPRGISSYGAAPAACPADPSPRAERFDPAVGFPDAPSTYIPLTGREKFHSFVKSTYAPYTFFSAAFGATLAQAQGQWYEYGGGMPGWGKRFGANLADTESRRFIQGFVLSAVLHQDPRYFPSKKSKKIPRAWYAATRVVVGKSDNGSDTFNSAEFLGALFTSSLQNAYYPEHDRGFGETMSRFLGALLSDASSNVLREFTPDMRRMIRRHAPEKIKQIEEKIPDPGGVYQPPASARKDN